MQTDNFIVFGRTVPEESKKYGHSVCMAGYSCELRQLMRVFPLPIQSNIHSREILSLVLERNPQDSRIESWALKTRSNDSIFNTNQKVKEQELRDILVKHTSKNLIELNEKRLSLGIIKPDSFTIKIKSRTDVFDPTQKQLFDDFIESAKFKTASDYYYAPYIEIDSFAGQREFQLREWGCYELLRKHEEINKRIDAETIRKALHIEDNKDIFFIIGNMNKIRNIWLIIKVFVFKRIIQKNLFKTI